MKYTLNLTKHVNMEHFKEQDSKCWFRCICFEKCDGPCKLFVFSDNIHQKLQINKQQHHGFKCQYSDRQRSMLLRYTQVNASTVIK